MSLKKLADKTKVGHKVEIAGEEFFFCELSPKESESFELEAEKLWAQYLKTMDDVEEPFKDTLKHRRLEFITWFKAWKQVNKAGEDIDWEEFYSLGEIYLNEIVLMMHYKLKEVHPEYYARLSELEQENNMKLSDILKAAQEKQES